MRIAISLLLLLVLDTPASACWFDPCKPAIHHVQKAKPNPLITKHEKRIADLERRLLLAEAMLAGHEAALGAQQHQLSRLAPR